MVPEIREKRIKFLLLSYIIFALIGSSAISTGEAFFLKYSNNDNLSSGYLSSIDHNIDLLASVTIRKAGSHSNSTLRNRLLRVFTFSGAIAIAAYLVREKQITKTDNIPVIKNLVLLKLRI